MATTMEAAPLHKGVHQGHFLATLIPDSANGSLENSEPWGEHDTSADNDAEAETEIPEAKTLDTDD